MGPTPPCYEKFSAPNIHQNRAWKTHSEEDPLQHLAVVSWLFHRIEPELVFGVIMLREIEHDSSGLEDRESLCPSRGRSVPVHQDGNFSIRVQGVDVPWLLLLVGPDRDVLHAGGGGRMVRREFGKPFQTHSYATLSP